VPQATYAALTELCVTDRAGFSLGHSPSCAHELWPAAIQPYVALVCRLMVSQ